MSCDKEVSSEEGKIFAEVFVCSNCFLVAERIYQRAERELKQLLVMMKESIRLGLLQKKLQFASVEQVDELSKPELLKRVAELADESCKMKTPSTESTPPHVATLAAIGNSSSSKPSPAD